MSHLPEPMRWFLKVDMETIHDVCIDIFGVGWGTISMHTGHFLELYTASLGMHYAAV